MDPVLDYLRALRNLDPPAKPDGEADLAETVRALVDWIERRQRVWLEPASRVDPLARRVEALERMLRHARGVRGCSVHTADGAFVVAGPGESREPPMAAMARPRGFWAALGTGTSDGDNRWSYPFTERVKTSTGYDGWTDKTDGRSGTARNACEDVNSASGAQGNGVDVGNLDTADFTFTIQQAPAGSIVWIVPVTFTPEGGERTTEYWFWHENGVDGSCD